ncbi:polysaccharide biosynthesis tyrosine autokinase [Pseudonocardia sp. WMMC193]|uniref:polysaccharide biosynthesis tyrosine autokinase n=1 Tax=Pseudonocardia sp. WMMC193 TaxID=2911965 RepID=UPI001F00DF5F|nr:polysaccharide biosynthesis tyrosine autokinase [Pseudonocardia sp. WMMC193]MCF7553841.1 polysaccharide biosynthesis tyrosine autokinase [Pseudonocardia sp. WMMC193]
MTLREFLKIMRERWLFVALSVVICVVSAATYFATRPAEYTSTVSMYVSSQTGDTPQAAFQGAQLSTQRVKSYTGLVNSTRVTSAVISQLGLDATPKQLAGQISASSATDSVVIDVAVTDTDPVEAAAIANATADVFGRLVADLERPTDPQAPAPVAIRVVERAVPSEAPSSAGLLKTLLPGLALGLILGVATALLRNTLDNTVKRPSQLHAATSLPTLGSVAKDPNASERPLIVADDPRSPRAEAFRQIRTNLQFSDVDSPPKVVLVTSSVQSEGKSVTTANLALTLAAANMSVLVIDADLRRPRQDVLFGIEGAIGLTSVLSGRIASVEQAVQSWGDKNLDILASGPLPANPSELLASQQMRKLLMQVRNRYDMVIIDAPPLLPVTDAAAIAPATDGAVLVCRAGKTTSAQLVVAKQALDSVSARILGTILTMTGGHQGSAYSHYGSYYGTRVPEPQPEPEEPVEEPVAVTVDEEPEAEEPAPKATLVKAPFKKRAAAR